ncbi:MAG: rhomboid family intramembrane serine protease [Planctomycetes bacterium]|nr:rhomboid family intramembrane serine protease [Planctomycetota bacterium]
MLIPIRTESAVRRTPAVNYALIAVNVLVFLLLNQTLLGRNGEVWRDRYLAFQSSEPAVHEFFTYQFLHADIRHLLGNMLFLWVFGNSVNAKMGAVAYLLFYLAGGVFAAWGNALLSPGHFTLVGASGAIAAVTTAYLALFPRSHVTVLMWFVVIYTFEVPAMLLIGLKIIVWDNLVAPSFGGAGPVAHEAHLAGYFFGFVAALLMLWIRALPRDQFDILALWKRWKQRRDLAQTMADPARAARAQFGPVARAPAAESTTLAAEERRLDEVHELRRRIDDALESRDLSTAAGDYERLLGLDPRQCLSELSQLDVGREFYRTNRSSLAATAFERFLDCYPNSRELGSVRLLLGIIYARDLKQYELAEKHLTQTLGNLADAGRKAQCAEWLETVRRMLGRPVPEANS